MPKCSLCKTMYEFPHGLTLVLNDGSVLHFCSSKCRKNFNLGRKSHKIKWVKKRKHTRAERIAEIKEEAAEHAEEKQAEEEKKEEKKEDGKADKKEEKSEKK